MLDIGRTLQYLETKGVPVAGFQTDTLPAFYSCNSDFKVDYRIESAAGAAAAITAKRNMGLAGGMVIAVPIPQQHTIDDDHTSAVIDEALAKMHAQGVTGKDTMPFLLARIAEKTGGRSLQANIELVLNNADVAAQIACQLTTPQS